MSPNDRVGYLVGGAAALVVLLVLGINAMEPAPRGASNMVAPVVVARPQSAPIPQNGSEATTVFPAQARTLIRPDFVGYEVAEVRPNLGGVTVRYENTRLQAPTIALSIQYAARPPDRRLPRGYRPIRIDNHRGMRAEVEGRSILSWWSGQWIFTLATRSDQGPGEFHVVDVFAHEIASYADQQSAIRFVADAGEVQTAVDEASLREQQLAAPLDAGNR